MKKAIKTLLSFLTTCMSEARFSSHSSTKRTYPNRLNIEIHVRTQSNVLSKTDMKEISKNVKKSFSPNFVLENVIISIYNELYLF